MNHFFGTKTAPWKLEKWNTACSFENLNLNNQKKNVHAQPGYFGVQTIRFKELIPC